MDAEQTGSATAENSLPPRWGWAAELGVIGLWALVVGHQLLNFNPQLWPAGHEFGMAIHPNFIWTQLWQCGDCVFWNGFFNGGYPAFTELHAAVLHPLVIISTVIWGGVNGGKAIIIGSLWMGGMAQWWMAHTMRLGRVARVWSGCLAVAAGHLSGKMELGVLGLVISMAACSLLFAPLLGLLTRTRIRDQQLFGIALALLIVSGQGYLQIGMAVVVPILALLLIQEKKTWWRLAISTAVGLWLAGIFLVPFFHFYPNFGKDLDTFYRSSQPLNLIPLNLVINDPNFYREVSLSKQPYGYLYMTYIGWVPVVLALWGTAAWWPTHKRLFIALWAAVGSFWFLSSGQPFIWLAQIAPTLAGAVRNPTVISGLSVPLILLLSAYGVERIWHWPQAMLVALKAEENPSFWHIYWGRVLLAGLLPLALWSTYQFSQHWLTLYRADFEGTIAAAADSQSTYNAAWVSFPYGEHFWGPFAGERGLKVTNQVRPAFWQDRPTPNPAYEITATEPSLPYQPVPHTNYYQVLHPTEHYAAVLYADGRIQPCEALAQGGHIDVTCNTTESGKLVVQENAWVGWHAAVDGSQTPRLENRWLAVAAPVGKHSYQFRYRPWDVYVGAFISLMGIFVLVYYQVQIGRETRPT